MVDSTLSVSQPYIQNPVLPESVTEVDLDSIRSLPKVVLHDHLDGGLRPETIIDIAQQIGYTDLPKSEPEALRQWFFDAANSGDLPTYLETFAHSTAVMQRAEDITRITREAVEDLADDGVVYAELRFAPEQHQERGLSLEQVVDAAIEGVRAGEQSVAERIQAGGDDAPLRPIAVRLLLCGMRQADRCEEIAHLTSDYVGDGDRYVVGFDIAGPESGFPPCNHEAAFAHLRSSLVPVTIHAGEAEGVDSIEDALQQGAIRLGHGARIFEDLTVGDDDLVLQKVGSVARDRRIVLELCPTSNVQTGVCESLADHPFPLLYEMGFACTVNPDNRLVSGTSMTQEMRVLVENFGFGYEDLLRITCNAVNAAFAPLTLRDHLLRTYIMPAFDEAIESAAQAAADSAAESAAE